jgi:hypothetical protein
MYQYATSVATQTITQSIFAKKNTNKYLGITLAGDITANRYQVIFNLETGAVAQEKNTPTSLTGKSFKIENYGNGWYRCTMTATFPANQSPYMVLQNSNIISTNFNATTLDWADGTVGNLYLWGCQVEAGAYATSYIPTLGASVTRVADAASKTGISSLIGQTEGTLFVEANVPSGFDANNLFITLSDGTSDNMVFINRVAGKAEYYVSQGGLTIASFSMGTILSTGVHKLAVAYKANDFVFYVDGVLINTDTSGNVPAMSRINLGSYVAAALPYNDGIKQALLFKTRLTNAQLAELTAL